MNIANNEIDDAKPEHITADCNVLLHAMLERARIAGQQSDLLEKGRQK